MVGRDRELRRLKQLAASRHPQVAVIAGEPGVGKTRLVEELLGSLPDEAMALVGHAEPSSLARPYEVLLDAVDGVSGLDEDLLEQLTDAARSPVERLHSAIDIVDRLIGERPAVILFEDLHWVDSESAALFERLADQAGPRVLVGTYRPDEVTSRHPVAAVLARLERRHAVTRVRLQRLTESDTAALLAAKAGAPVPYRTVAALHERTGGNPFFLEELVHGHEDCLDALCDQPLPWSLAEALRQQVDDLDPRTRQVGEAAAVLGYRISFDLLATVTGVGEDDLIRTLRELVTRGVLVEAGDDEFTFRHALVGEAITEQLLGRQRRRLHEAALDALLATEGPDDLVAYHAWAAGRYDDMVDAARRGAQLYLSIGSPYQALQLAEMGLDEVSDDIELLAAAARSAWLVGLVEDAVGHARSWLALADSAVERAGALYLLVRVTWEAELVEEMERYTRDVEALVAELPPGEVQAKAMAAVAQSAILRDDTAAATSWADRAIALATELDLPAVRIAAQVEKSHMLVDFQPNDPATEETLRSLADEAEKLGEWMLAARALLCFVQNVPPASLTEHAELLERMRVDAERAGNEHIAVAAYYEGKGRIAMREGDLAGAVAAIEQGRERHRQYRRRGRRADYHGVFLAGLYLEAGKLDLAERVVDDLRAVAVTPSRTTPGLAFHLACRRGDVAAADQLLDEVLALITEQSWRSAAQAHDLISAALHAGLPRDRILRMHADLLDPNVTDDHRTLVDAQVAELRGEHAEALAGYLAAAPAATLPAAVRGTAEVGAARCLLATGARDDAVPHVQAAAKLLDRWAGWRVDQLEQLRTRLGLPATGAPYAVTGVAALTNREREVALLVADGLTNAELARRLYIAPKTAAVHVSNILHKLDVSSRTEVATALAQDASIPH